MKVLLFGANGQVGTDCHQALSDAGHEVIASSRKDTDFSDTEAVFNKAIAEQPGLVVNACAYTAVDKAEEEKELADKINHLSVKALAEACLALKIPLLHISTDYVFKGDGEVPYTEGSPVQPLGVYGATKLEGEQAIEAVLPEHIILRTSWVFGEQGNNFVKTMIRLGADRDQLNVVDDQYGKPSYVGDIVSVLVFLVGTYAEKGALPWGVYHCSSEGEVSWFQFAQAIFSKAFELGVLDKQVNVNPIPSSEFPTPAPRPSYSVLDTSKLTALMGEALPHWERGLALFLNSLVNKG